MAVQDIQKRLEDLDNFSGELEKQTLYILSDHYGNFMGLPKSNLLDEKWKRAIKEICLEWDVKVLFLDNLSSLCPGIDENSKELWDSVNQCLIDLRFNGISVIFFHHMGKKDIQRGTSAHEDNVDISISLIHPPGYVPQDGCRFITKFTKNRIRTTDLPLIADREFWLKEMIGLTAGLSATHSSLKSLHLSS